MSTLIKWAEALPRPVRWMVTVVWMIIFLILLLQPEKNPVISTGIPPGPVTLEREILFTTLHMCGFIVTTTVWWWALWGHFPSAQAILIAAIIALVMSFSTEYLQSLTPDRFPQISDLIANTLGVGLVCLIIRQVTKYEHQRRQQIPAH